jgi:ubiquinone/menaquinone biosynthesis C-methylase UbiE
MVDPVRSESVDAVVVTNVLHLVEDWHRALPKGTRVRSADGVIWDRPSTGW